MKLGCVNPVRKMSDKWSRLDASQGGGQPRLKHVNLISCDVIGHREPYQWTRHLLPADTGSFESSLLKRCYFILALSFLSPSYLPDDCHLSPSAVTK